MSLPARLRLYPGLEPYNHGRLSVGGGHEIYFEECGNPAGKPALIVHGGPGGGCNAAMRRFHDPARYRVILFDQRGCGRSSPYACLSDNTTWHLVGDMEAIRKRLGIESWQLFGGSWGSTLSLAYAQAHPGRVSELILRGIFLLRRTELEWFYQEGCSWVYPDAFADFAAHIPDKERGDLIAAYYKRLTQDDSAVQLQAAKAWSIWEGRTLSIKPDAERVRAFGADHYALAFARIECHYFVNGGFFETDGQLLDNAHRLNGIRGIIVQGRYDVVTPMKTAWDLAKAWRDGDLKIVPDAGHAMSEPGIIHELVLATRQFASAQ